MLKKILVSLAAVLLMAVLALAGVLYVAFLGPSATTRDVLTLSCLETSAAKFVPRIYLSAATVAEIVAKNSVAETDDITDPSLVTPFKPPPPLQPGESAPPSETPPEGDEWADYPDGIRLEYVKGDRYRGYVLLIRDPSRVYTATSSDFRGDAPGLRITEAYQIEGAVVAVNGGGFPDAGGIGDGNIPKGLVFSKGVHLWGSENTVYSSVVGFDSNNVLVVGNMSPATAKKMGIRDAVCFGPTLVKNGEPASIQGSGSGLNPRTAIGQRADGTVILLCVDGRMPSSMGASYGDLIDIMMQFSAVNASNLDGGTSTVMIYNGEQVNVRSSLYNPRRMPTFIMVRP
ncbi:MAG: phosphodiester glycosidase family protein [Oscillospiraceae bacterium]|jgi:exopolysaccharide biosynthesis protein|nr:phosphodiester glycosidase family protein [Oscillospiraceae bacterium]